MIPRNLPPLAKSAIEYGWDVHVEQRPHTVYAQFVRDGETVSMWWDTLPDRPRIVESMIGTSPTPYAQCTRLIRSTEGNPS